MNDTQFPFKLPETLMKAASGGRLIGVTVHFGKSVSQDRYLSCVPVPHDLKAGTETDRLPSDEDMIADFKKNVPGSDEAVRRFFTQRDCTATFSREFEAIDMISLKAFDIEYNYWVQVMEFSTQHDPFWFYRVQPKFKAGATGARLSSWSEAATPPPVPFWLVSKFNAFVTTEGLTDLIPLEWTPIVYDPASVTRKAWCLPHLDITLFVR